MTTKSVVSLGEHLKNDFVGAVDKAKEVTGEIRERVDAGYRTVQRGITRAKGAAGDAIEDARHEIKTRPLTITATVAATGFAVGLLTGWLVGRKR